MSHASTYLLRMFIVTAVVYYVPSSLALIEIPISIVANQTLCPVKEEINEDKNRRPQFIKYIRCAKELNSVCKDGITYGCCEHSTIGFHSECVELWERVPFHFTDSPGETKLWSVPIGCNCLITESTTAAGIKVNKH